MKNIQSGLIFLARLLVSLHSNQNADMRVLLLGEYSNVHWTLACALRKLGHEVVVVSNGGEWKA